MSNFSKLEQKIGARIPNKRILGKSYSFWSVGIFYVSNFYCYIAFNYKNIISYCLIQVYSSFFMDKIVIRDIYTLPDYRRKNCAGRIINQILYDYKINLDNLFFSSPVSPKLKSLLKKMGANKIKEVYGEKFNIT